MKKFEAAFATWIVNNRLKVIALSFLLVLVPGTGMSKLYFDSSYRIFFSDDNPQLAELESIEATYTESHNVIIVVAPDDGDVFTARTLQAIEEGQEDVFIDVFAIQFQKDFQSSPIGIAKQFVEMLPEAVA